MVAKTLDSLPSNLPQLKSSEVPWRLTNAFYTPELPGKFANFSNGYRHDLIAGGFVTVGEEMEIRFQMSEVDNSKSSSSNPSTRLRKSSTGFR